MFAPGAQLGSYQILAPLGAGAMGVVYRARDLRLDREVAIKILPDTHTANPEARRRFLQEARAASALDHVNICTIHGIEETEDGQHYLVMACYDGETLQVRIARGPLDLATASDVITQVAHGLHHAHSAGVVHRDIKPANVLVTRRGVVKILDFGLAKLEGMATMTQAGSIVGTLSYMSPEQVRGLPLDTRTDIWSAGVVFYELLAGRGPFEGETLMTLPRAITQGTIPIPIPTRGDVPAPVTQILRRMLARDRSDRYPSMAALLDDLQRVMAAAPAATAVYSAVYSAISDIRTVPSIAVLSFTDMSAAKDQEYFCEGMAEELINALTALDGIHVAARRSAFQFKGAAGDVAEIGRRLNVGAVLEGSVRKSGTRLRVTAQLVDVGNGYHIWSERFDSEVEDVFAVQDEIARRVVDALRVKLLGDADQPLVLRHTDNLEAYHDYLMGRHCRFTLYDIRRAIESFERAAQRDPGYARAHAALADCFNVLGLYGALPSHAASARARASAMRALESDPTLAEAHAALAQGLFLFDWDWAGAEREFRHALELEPASVETRCWYGYFLAATGRPDAGLAEVRTTGDRDPLSAYAASYASVILYVARHYDAAILEAQRALAIQPGFGVAVNSLALTYAALGRFGEALEHAEMLVDVGGRTAHALQTLGMVLARSGRQDKARAILGELEQRARAAYVSAICQADIHAALGETDAAFALLEQAWTERAPTLHTLRFESSDSLRSDPRWDDLVQRLAFPA
ncbi:MAG: protein kinase [Acidobacteria bacterium]|nr:protein kinase [Acidobacteriota bacterium]